MKLILYIVVIIDIDKWTLIVHHAALWEDEGGESGEYEVPLMDRVVKVSPSSLPRICHKMKGKWARDWIVVLSQRKTLLLTGNEKINL